MAQEFISLADAAAISGLSLSHLRLLARTGKIEARKIGRDWITTWAAVETYLADEQARSRDPHKAGKHPRRRLR